MDDEDTEEKGMDMSDLGGKRDAEEISSIVSDYYGSLASKEGKEFYDTFVSRYKTLLMEMEPLLVARAYEDAYRIVKGED